jgi:hypothetical protein
MLLATKGVWEDNHIENNNNNDQNHDVEPVPHPYDTLLHHLLEITSSESGMYICVCLYTYLYFCFYVQMFMYVYMYIYIYLCINIFINMYFHRCKNLSP